MCWGPMFTTVTMLRGNRRIFISASDPPPRITVSWAIRSRSSTSKTIRSTFTMSKVPIKRENEESPLVLAKSDEESSPPLKSSNKKARKNIPANRWTDEEWKLLYDLKQQGLSWRCCLCSPRAHISVIAGSFPGRTAHGVRLHYQNHIREETEVFSPEKVSYLREVTDF
jgi:hypothetical protein